MMGVVYRAFDPVLGRPVALKTVGLAFALPEGERRLFEERFLSEARVAAGLAHPGIVVVHDAGRDAATGTLFIAFEHLEGRTLADLTADGAGPAPVRDTGRGYQADGCQVRERLAAQAAPVAQTVDLTFIYERATPDGRIEREFEPVRLRYFHRFEIEHLLARAGYEVEALYGDWGRGPFVENGQEMIWVARRT